MGALDQLAKRAVGETWGVAAHLPGPPEGAPSWLAMLLLGHLVLGFVLGLATVAYGQVDETTTTVCTCAPETTTSTSLASTTTTTPLPAPLSAPSWLPYMSGAWYLDEPAGTPRLSATGNPAATLYERKLSYGPSTITIPNDMTNFVQGTGSARWNNHVLPLAPADGHSTVLHCDEAACGTLFAARPRMSMGCWVFPTANTGTSHREHHWMERYFNVSGPVPQFGWRAFWSQGGPNDATGRHVGAMLKDGGATQNVYLTTGPSGSALRNQWYHAVITVDMDDPVARGRTLLNGIINNRSNVIAVADAVGQGLNLSSHIVGLQWTGNLDECFFYPDRLMDAEACRICACGIDGSGCSCDPLDPTQYVTTGRLATHCRHEICLGGVDTPAHYDIAGIGVETVGPGGACNNREASGFGHPSGGCQGGGTCSVSAVPCDLSSVPCDQSAPSRSLP